MDELDDTHVLTLTESYPQILCKPSVEAFEAAIRIANMDPKKTVRLITYLKSNMGILLLSFDYFVYISLTLGL